jgi:iron complex outermembrane receptor protein
MKTLPYYLALGVLAATSLQAFGQSNDLDIIDSTNVVLTPTRLRQSLSEVPVSVTVITADMLFKYGIGSVPEALRLVPGMAVTQESGGNYTINYHGSNSLVSRRMNVLIDGMSVYRSAFAQVDWTMLPVAMEDIERIEVTRGPNSASYGPNSMLAIINIITRHPNESAGTSLSGSTGSRQTRTATARHGGKLGNSTNFWITLDHQETEGFAEVFGKGFTQPGLDPHHDRSERQLLNFRSSTELATDENLEFRLSALNGKQENQLFEAYQRSFPDVGLQERDIGVTWQKTLSPAHELKVSAYISKHSNDQKWIECLPALAYLPELGTLWKANPNYVLAIIAGRLPSGGSPADNLMAAAAIRAIRALGAKATAPACGTTNQDYVENRADIEIQNTTVISDSLRFVAGAGGRRDTAESATYLGGKVGNNTWRVFANAEYRPRPSIIVNAGGYYESDNLTGSSFSPRIAMNKHINANNTVRVVLSRANRMPGIIEQRANWSYLTTGLNPALLGVTEAYYAQSARAPGNLEAEKNTSREIGYNGNFPAHGLMVDAKLFEDRLSNLISQRLTLSDFSPTNNNSLKLRGAEFQVDYAPVPKWNVHAGYSYLDASASTPLELTQYSKHSGVIAASHLLPEDLRLSLAVYQNDGVSTGQNSFGKQELTLAKSFRVGSSILTPAFTVTHLNNQIVRYFYDIDKSLTNRVSDEMQYRFILKATF